VRVTPASAVQIPDRWPNIEVIEFGAACALFPGGAASAVQCNAVDVSNVCIAPRVANGKCAR
jgi:hypothetical protein